MEQGRAPPILSHHAELACDAAHQPPCRGDLIASTTTQTGLTVRCELDTNTYPKGIKVSEQQMATLNLQRDAFHPDWNYVISPREHDVER